MRRSLVPTLACALACSGSSSKDPEPRDEAPAPAASRAPTRSPGPAPADEATVHAACSGCHPMVAPDALNKQDWEIAITHLDRFVLKKRGQPLPPPQLAAILAYHQQAAPDRLTVLEPTPADSPVAWRGGPLGTPAHDLADEREPAPRIINVNVAELDGDPGAEVLVCDAVAGTVSLIDDGTERVLAMLPVPGRTEVVDLDRDGDRDVLVAVLGNLMPTEQKVGAVVLLENDGRGQFAARTLVAGLPRTTDARAGDVDGDGDLDIAVAAFGFISTGEIGLLEQTRRGRFEYRVLLPQPGAIHVPMADLDGDGDLDIATIIAQEKEQVAALVGDGKGGFTFRELWAAGTPTFGSSGLELADLDGDGDGDLVFTNGDLFDAAGFGPRPYHGVQWLENRGGLDFAYHRLAGLYGTYGADVGDLDGDGDLDIAAVSMFNVWTDPRRQSVIWLENDGSQGFTAHAVGSDPIHQVTVSVGDLDGDGRAEIVTGGIHGLAGPRQRIGRVTVWRR